MDKTLALEPFIYANILLCATVTAAKISQLNVERLLEKKHKPLRKRKKNHKIYKNEMIKPPGHNRIYIQIANVNLKTVN